MKNITYFWRCLLLIVGLGCFQLVLADTGKVILSNDSDLPIYVDKSDVSVTPITIVQKEVQPYVKNQIVGYYNYYPDTRLILDFGILCTLGTGERRVQNISLIKKKCESGTTWRACSTGVIPSLKIIDGKKYGISIISPLTYMESLHIAIFEIK